METALEDVAFLASLVSVVNYQATNCLDSTAHKVCRGRGQVLTPLLLVRQVVRQSSKFLERVVNEA